MPSKNVRVVGQYKKKMRPARQAKVELYRKASKRNNITPGRRSTLPFPRNFYCSLKYHDSIDISSSTGFPGIHTFCMNSLYDPSVTDTGHQPRYFDSLCGNDGGSAPYGKYRVHFSKIKCTFMNNNSSTGGTGYVGIRLRNSTATALSTLTADNICELPNLKYKLCNVQTGWSNYHTFSMPAKIKTFLGVKDLRDDSESSATYSSDPASLVYADVFYIPFNETSTATYQVSVQITYYVQFFDLNLPAMS